ncbi:hypothetical protein GCM10011594_12990 [Nakamurella endophytica]|uniref:Uncharacterized protein n=1 Tax=Nakamurella endophytica TaxID=1748367 RepID=A0A917SRY8_9ACTN|nr:hypothetical protein GCM10011594_12990 [Nakamurella endophytica]
MSSCRPVHTDRAAALADSGDTGSTSHWPVAGSYEAPSAIADMPSTIGSQPPQTSICDPVHALTALDRPLIGAARTVDHAPWARAAAATGAPPVVADAVAPADAVAMAGDTAVVAGIVGPSVVPAGTVPAAPVDPGALLTAALSAVPVAMYFLAWTVIAELTCHGWPSVHGGCGAAEAYPPLVEMRSPTRAAVLPVGSTISAGPVSGCRTV